MIKPPASFIFDFDEEDTQALIIFTKDHEGKHEYIRRDLIQAILDYVGVITYEPHQVILELVDKIEQSEQ